MKTSQQVVSTFLVVLAFSQATRAAADPVVLVAGFESDNVVQFDLTTGRWSEIAHLPAGTQPRGITVGDKGEIFLSLQGGKKNIVKLAPGNGITPITDVTGPIGRFGPGMIVFGSGKIWAAGDTDRVIYRIDPQTGEVAVPPQYENCCNLVGLAADGETLYAAEYFQRSILRYDLRSEKAEAVRFISKSPDLDRPIGMTIGHNGNLYVANALMPTVVEFDVKTGDFVRTLVDLGVAGKQGINGMIFAPEKQRYYLASGSDVHELDAKGNLIASYNSPALKKAYGIALLPSRLRTAVARTNVSPENVSPSAASSPAALTSRVVTTLRMTGGSLQIAGTPGEHYQVLATTDFQTWQPIAVLDNVTGFVEFVDPAAGKLDKRFYRLELRQTSR